MLRRLFTNRFRRDHETIISFTTKDMKHTGKFLFRPTVRRKRGYLKTAKSCRGIVATRQLVLFSLDSMGWAVAFRLGGTSIVSTVESHLLLVNELWLAVDEIVHHDDVVLLIVVRSRGNVAGRDPNRRDASIVKLDAEKGQVSIARRGWNETAE